MKVKIQITPKNGVLDPQGKAIQKSLLALGFDEVLNVRQGKYIEIDIKEQSIEQTRLNVEEMCEKLLANTIIENYQIDLD
tara:strand:- start:1528 stop:1767 length:240 start_codon:yes stop_codon:yes gene_type:complete